MRPVRLLLLVMLVAGGMVAGCVSPEGPTCGDGVCEPGEDATSCPADCLGPYCGDGTCDATEDCGSCPQDCGQCQTCGDGTCAGDEDCTTCPQDCGRCPVCGDGECSLGETCSSCPQDCGQCVPECGDGHCGSGETCSNCPQDCGQCPEDCGDLYCDPSRGENCASCPMDCGECQGNPCMIHDGPGAEGECVRDVCLQRPGCCTSTWDATCIGLYEAACQMTCPATCGDGVCQVSESCDTCAVDCGPCPPSCGNGTCDGTETCLTCPGDCGQCRDVDACEEHEGPGAEGECVQCVCAADPYCCIWDWDQACVQRCIQCGGECSAPSCGDGRCDQSAGETRFSCPEDCGTIPSCGDGVCEPPEYRSCRNDCGPLPQACGNGTCDDDEGTWNCRLDCGSGDGSPCEIHASPGTSDATVSYCVCAIRGECCRDGWDGRCVEIAVLSCGVVCSPSCGNGVCDGDEDCRTCPADCGRCAECGDGICAVQGGEDCRTCPADCGRCAECGDGICAVTEGEDCHTCPADCGRCHACGNGVCEWEDGEDGVNCPHDCYCGDGVCAPDENPVLCPLDCYCGDGICSPGEDGTSCTLDCTPV